MRKGHQVTFAQPTDVSYARARDETRPPDSLPPEPGLPVSHQAGPGPVAAQGQCRVLLSLDPESARAAREFTAATLRGWQFDEVIFEAVLIATELVTNAIRHGGCRAAAGSEGNGQVELAWQRDASRVICVVTDGSSRVPVLGPADPESESGRGLQVVQALASSWGWVMLGDTQKAVWAALRLPVGSLSRLPWRLPALVLAVTGLDMAARPRWRPQRLPARASRLQEQARDGAGRVGSFAQVVTAGSR